MELNREQIIKALELCAFGQTKTKCFKCPYCRDKYFCDREQFKKDAFSLIKELTEDNEDLNKTISSLLETIKDIKADTARKMQLRFKDELWKSEGRIHFTFELCELIDQIAKKTLEE